MAKQPDDESRRAAGICSSIRKGSYARMALVGCAAPEEACAQTEPIDPRDYWIILCKGKEDEGQ